LHKNLCKDKDGNNIFHSIVLHDNEIEYIKLFSSVNNFILEANYDGKSAWGVAKDLGKTHLSSMLNIKTKIVQRWDNFNGAYISYDNSDYDTDDRRYKYGWVPEGYDFSY
jgi:hypothetical protein